MTFILFVRMIDELLRATNLKFGVRFGLSVYVFLLCRLLRSGTVLKSLPLFYFFFLNRRCPVHTFIE